MKFRGKDAATVMNMIDEVGRPQPFISATAAHGIHLTIHLEGAERKSRSG